MALSLQDRIKALLGNGPKRTWIPVLDEWRWKPVETPRTIEIPREMLVEILQALNRPAKVGGDYYPYFIRSKEDGERWARGG